MKFFGKTLLDNVCNVSVIQWIHGAIVDEMVSATIAAMVAVTAALMIGRWDAACCNQWS